MAVTDGMKITNAGLTVLAHALAGEQLTFTKCAAGDGNLTSQNVATMNNLIAPKLNMSITALHVTQDIGTAELVCEMSNAGLSRGFWAREFGIFAKDPHTGAEVLYSYRNVGNNAAYMPPDTSTDKIYYSLNIMTIINQAQNVTAIFKDSNRYVTESGMKGAINGLFGNARAIKGFWTFSNGDSQILRPVDVESFKREILSSIDIAQLDEKIKSLENTIAYLGSQIQDSDDSNYTPYVNVKFSGDYEGLDAFVGDAENVIKNNEIFNCNTYDGIIPGSYYMLSDGVNQEYVQIDGIITTNDGAKIILTAPVKNSYVNNKAALYRTSAQIMQGYTSISMGNKYKTWLADISWRGQYENTEYKIALGTSQSDMNNFYIDGQAAFNAAGQVTLTA